MIAMYIIVDSVVFATLLIGIGKARRHGASAIAVLLALLVAAAIVAMPMIEAALRVTAWLDMASLGIAPSMVLCTVASFVYGLWRLRLASEADLNKLRRFRPRLQVPSMRWPRLRWPKRGKKRNYFVSAAGVRYRV